MLTLRMSESSKLQVVWISFRRAVYPQDCTANGKPNCALCRAEVTYDISQGSLARRISRVNIHGKGGFY